MTTISARDFNRDVSAAKRAAQAGPVTITDRGRAAFVLLTPQDYEALTDDRPLTDVISMNEDIDFEPPRLTDPLPCEHLR
ncbi:type II toxin-antitoxin system Phd/YefM family antitoxin [Brachybacterium timonense]|uniref:type II toxin-antitoxin system Phd/YefM family antitoxin n=1 Tax=Brachybacterium timonense TaxID=2050896 RepID=UPI000D0BCD55|nr:type II toxin-antitoxin system Phd/YefM family antitoxin [Brachybacterium timonense]